MKKTFLILSALSVLALASTALAQGFVPLAPIPGLTQDTTSILSSGNFAAFFNNLYKYCIGLSAVLAVIMIIWGGLEISTQDSVSKQGAGRERITQAIYGLILVLSPVLVFSIINPSILNLSLNLSRIDLTHSPTVTPTTSSTPSTDQLGDTVTYSTCALNTDTLCNAAMQACTNSPGGLAVGVIKCVKYPENNGIDTVQPDPNWSPTATPCRVGWRPGVMCTISNTTPFGVGA